MKSSRVLVVDDEPKMRRVLEILLKRKGHDVVCTGSGEQALIELRSSAVDLIISDLRMPGISGIDLLKSVRELGNDVPVIILTAYGTVETAVEAMKFGACEYLVRPFDVDALELAIDRVLAAGAMRRQNEFLRDEVERGWGEFVGDSPLMQKVYEEIRQVAPGKTTVMISGETGTGKELVARAIHRASPRAKALFVPINCAAIPTDLIESEMFGSEKGAFSGASRLRIGKFELADGGTLFLDEIAEMPILLQAKLLRVLQENVIERLGSNRSIPIDIRILAATNRDPRQAVADGKLRDDLFYRINVFNIQLPSLRERKQDIEELAMNFLIRQRSAGQISKAAIAVLQNYDWPGNVRELQNVIERAVVLSGGNPIDTSHLPLELSRHNATPPPIEQTFSLEPLSLGLAREQLDRRYIMEALRQAGDNKTKAARLLKVSERSLWYKIKQLGLE